MKTRRKQWNRRRSLSCRHYSGFFRFKEWRCHGGFVEIKNVSSQYVRVNSDLRGLYSWNSANKLKIRNHGWKTSKVLPFAFERIHWNSATQKRMNQNIDHERHEKHEINLSFSCLSWSWKKFKMVVSSF
jgi:hypothetical protein